MNTQITPMFAVFAFSEQSFNDLMALLETENRVYRYGHVLPLPSMLHQFIEQQGTRDEFQAHMHGQWYRWMQIELKNERGWKIDDGLLPLIDQNMRSREVVKRADLIAVFEAGKLAGIVKNRNFQFEDPINPKDRMGEAELVEFVVPESVRTFGHQPIEFPIGLMECKLGMFKARTRGLRVHWSSDTEHCSWQSSAVADRYSQDVDGAVKVFEAEGKRYVQFSPTWKVFDGQDQTQADQG